MDKAKIAAFADTVYRDMAGAMAIGMGYVGQRCGLFHHLAGSSPTTVAALAAATGLDRRYLEE